MGVEVILGALALGTAVSAGAQIYGAQQARKAGSREATEIERRAAEESRQFRLRARHTMGAQQGMFAASGVRTTEGSPLELLMESADELERGLEQIRLGSSAEAQLARFRGKEARRAGYLGAAGTLLGGAAQTMLTGQELGRTGRRFSVNETVPPYRGGYD